MISRVAGTTTFRRASACSQNSPRYSVSGLLRNLEFNWALSLLLHDDSSGRDLVSVANVENPQFDQVTCAKFRVDCPIEQGEIPCHVYQLQTNSDGPYISKL